MIRVFDRNGSPIGEINALYTCSWLLNAPGKLSFTLSVNDPKCREDFLRFGNLVLVLHDDLPAWGGVIDTPREWGDGNVRINAWGGEKLLDFRRGPVGRLLTGSGGDIFAQMINLAVNAGYLPILVGSVEMGGTSRQETLNDTMLTEVSRVVKRAGMEWYFEPVLMGDGRLYFVANCLQRAGKELQMELIESVHLKLSQRPLTEQGELHNDVMGYGEGVDWKARTKVVRVDDASIGLYGLRQGLIQFSGVTKIGTLTNNTDNYLNGMAHPRVSMDIDVANVYEAWRFMRLGNRFNVRLHSVGFAGGQFGMVSEIRAIGMEFDGTTLRIVGES